MLSPPPSWCARWCEETDQVLRGSPLATAGLNGHQLDIRSLLGRHRLALEGGHPLGIAGFGHVAVGLVSGRLHAQSSGRRLWVCLVTFALLAMLPDFDVFPVELGVPDEGMWGHRGVSHTPAFALLVGLAVALVMRARDRHPWRLGLAVALVVASHGVLDALAQGGRGMMFFWPLHTEPLHFPWRPIPDAPRGLAFFSRVGMHNLAIELVYFVPFSLHALWPRGLWAQLRRRRAARDSAAGRTMIAASRQVTSPSVAMAPRPRRAPLRATSSDP